jgi:metal-responsive CopG/Arc/MetJ family transcriptional regulator
MPSSHPRVQVSVDPELARAMAEVDPDPASRSRLIRDLALRGAEVERDARRQRADAIEHLTRIAHGEVEHDFATVAAAYAEREADRG